jgi:predicted small secreted protein
MKTLLLITLAALLAGCNTVSGMGRDIQKAGETLEGAANKKR